MFILYRYSHKPILNLYLFTYTDFFDRRNNIKIKNASKVVFEGYSCKLLSAIVLADFFTGKLINHTL